MKKIFLRFLRKLYFSPIVTRVTGLEQQLFKGPHPVCVVCFVSHPVWCHVGAGEVLPADMQHTGKCCRKEPRAQMLSAGFLALKESSSVLAARTMAVLPVPPVFDKIVQQTPGNPK